MNSALARRPLGCLKTSLRLARQQKMVFSRRGMATEAQTTTTTTTTTATAAETAAAVNTEVAAATRPPLNHGFFRIPGRNPNTVRSAFAVYPKTTLAGTQTLAPPPVNPLDALHQAQIQKMDPTGVRTALFAKTRDAAKVGDVLMVTHRRGGEPFAGVLLSIRRRGIDTAILLRNHLSKVGVELWFKVYNKNVAGIEVVKRAAKRARRARLTYMRKPKHDMGSVEELVYEWKRNRKVFTSGKAGKAAAGGKVGGKGGAKGGKAGAAAGGKKK
ncbi:translation protein SH3-like domain-containing protein [Chaetomium sp. MPI-SDFR-AT-0129]|nr:translation protein SH3-like domain-containing protein [Chaetomium sp. MPI-SDFR-AT-0129]